MNTSFIKYLQVQFQGMKLILLFLPLVGLVGYTQTLEKYLQVAAVQNPKLKSAYAQFEASMEKAPQVASLQDPTITMSAFGRMIETRLGAQQARFSLMQMFPWFGTLKAREDAANLMAEASFQVYLDLRNQVFYDLKSVYADIYALHKTIELKQENLDILNSYRELALSKFKSGNAPMVNVVRVDIQREEVITEIELQEDLIKPLQIQFNLLLNRNSETSVVVEDTLIFQDIFIPEMTVESFEEHPSVLGLKKQEQSYKMQEKAAEKGSFPMVGLGVDYSIISPRTDANPDRNGKDAIMPMVSISLPIFRKKYKAAKKEAELMATSTEYDRIAQKNDLKNDFETVAYQMNKAGKLIALYNKQLKSSLQANKLVISGFSNGLNDFEEVLEINQGILLYRIQKIEAIKMGFVAKAKLEYILSKTE